MNYSEEEKEELQELINLLYNNHLSQYGKRKLENYIKKQESIIDKMAEHLTTPVHSKEWIIEFYKKEVEKECNIKNG